MAKQGKSSAAVGDQHGVIGIECQPVNTVVWVDIGKLTANNYNPNIVAPPELKLLKLSIVEDGWTQPIVARTNGEIVDGFHRWSLASRDKDIQGMTGGKVPVVYLPDDASMDHQMMSTIRHNRARGVHYVLKMAEIVQRLRDDENVTEEDLMKRLGMEFEEMDRLYDRGGMIRRGSLDQFRKGWVPTVGERVEREDVGDETAGVTSKAAGGKKKAISAVEASRDTIKKGGGHG